MGLFLSSVNTFFLLSEQLGVPIDNYIKLCFTHGCDCIPFPLRDHVLEAISVSETYFPCYDFDLFYKSCSVRFYLLKDI